MVNGKLRRVLLIVDDQARLAVQGRTCRRRAVGHNIWVLLSVAGIADFDARLTKEVQHWKSTSMDCEPKRQLKTPNGEDDSQPTIQI